MEEEDQSKKDLLVQLGDEEEETNASSLMTFDFMGLRSSLPSFQNYNIDFDDHQEPKPDIHDETDHESSLDLQLRLRPPASTKKRTSWSFSKPEIDPMEEKTKKIAPAADLDDDDDDQQDSYWKIKNVLKKSDLVMSRIVIAKDIAETHILPHVVRENPDFDHIKGLELVVWDVDITRTEHMLVLKKWGHNVFVFRGDWTKEFVARRNLKENDEIGFRWDDCKSRLEFTVICRGEQ